MRTVMYRAMIVLAAFWLAACSSSPKRGKEEIMVLVQDGTAKDIPQRMPETAVKVPISYRGKEYQSCVERQPDESLPVVKNEQGESFIDNRITLRITCGNKQIIDRSFTKESFASLAGTGFMKSALLEEIVYDKTTPQGFTYAVSICHPQTDFYVPVRLTVTPDGKVSMVKEEIQEDVYVTDSL